MIDPEFAKLYEERRKAQSYLDRAKTDDKIAKGERRLLNVNRAITVRSLFDMWNAKEDVPTILVKHHTDYQYTAYGVRGSHEFDLLCRLFSIDGPHTTYVLVKVLSESGRPPFEGAKTPVPGSYKIGFGHIPRGEDVTDWADPDFMVAKDAYLSGRMNEFADMLKLNVGTYFEGHKAKRV